MFNPNMRRPRMNKKEQEGVTRREAMARIMQIIALAAGVSVSDLTFLLSTADAQTITKLKMLKVQLSGFDRLVFESEFGHITPLVPVQTEALQPGTIMTPDKMISGNLMGCRVHMGGDATFGAAACPSLDSCMANGGGSCPVLGECNENVCTGQDVGGGEGGPDDCGTNDCNGQSCTGLSSCGDNECTEQNCPNLSSCGRNKRDIVGLLDAFKTDSYVVNLMKHFNVTTARELATQVNLMIQQHRTITPIQLEQEALQLPLINPTK